MKLRIPLAASRRVLTNQTGNEDEIKTHNSRCCDIDWSRFGNTGGIADLCSGQRICRLKEGFGGGSFFEIVQQHLASTEYERAYGSA